MRSSTTRRDFVRTTAAAGLLAATQRVQADDRDVLRVGLVGCGGRGTGAATQALAADPGARLVAMDWQAIRVSSESSRFSW